MTHRSSSRPLFRAGVVASSAVIVGVLAACSGSGSSGAPTDAPRSTATATVTTSPSNSGAGSTTAPSSTAPSSTSHSATAGASGGGSGATSTSLCAESQLRASIDQRPVRGSTPAGDLALIIDFENTSERSCVIRGYPGAALVNSAGQQVKQATRTIRGLLLGLPVGQNSLPSVMLRPGAYASAGIEGVNQHKQGTAQAGCVNSYYPLLLVTPPNTTTAVSFRQPWPVCTSFTVHPTNIEKNPPG